MNSDYISQFRELLKREAEAITCVAERMPDEQIHKAVSLLFDCQGKVILIGIGKSGFIARKIAATLTSTGTRAVFLHPSDALHGDLGIIAAADVVMLLSNSGETDEIVAMLPYLRHRKVALIAITGNLESTLAREADVVLDGRVDREVCPLNLAPTTSTTVALAIGDAVAITLMEMKKLKPEDFALNHPSGRLGKRLTLRVGDLMRRGVDHPRVTPTASWLEVVTAITQGGLGAVSVVDEANMLVGIITDGDLRRTIQKSSPAELPDLVANAFMTCQPITITASELAYIALQVMENRPSQISVLPVVDSEHRSVGLLRLHDLVRSGL